LPCVWDSLIPLQRTGIAYWDTNLKLISHLEKEFPTHPFYGEFFTSAKTGEGLDKLADTITKEFYSPFVLT